MNWTSLHKWGSPKWFYSISGSLLPWLAAAGTVLLVIGLAWGLAFTPPDYQQGDSFRIIYIHVPSALLAQSIYVMMAAAGVIGLVWKIWGKPTWGAYWVWDARLTSMLILLFLYFGVIALGQAIPNRESAAQGCAVLAIAGVINIPIIKYSVEWWNTLHQPASFSLAHKPAMPAQMWLPLLLAILAFYCFFGAVLFTRMRLEVLRREAGSRWADAEIARLLEDRT